MHWRLDQGTLSFHLRNITFDSTPRWLSILWSAFLTKLWDLSLNQNSQISDIRQLWAWEHCIHDSSSVRFSFSCSLNPLWNQVHRPFFMWWKRPFQTNKLRGLAPFKHDKGHCAQDPILCAKSYQGLKQIALKTDWLIPFASVLQHWWISWACWHLWRLRCR